MLCNKLVFSNLVIKLYQITLFTMKDFCKLYQSQYKKAKETLDILEKQRDQIDLKLHSNPSCFILHKEL